MRSVICESLFRRMWGWLNKESSAPLGTSSRRDFVDVGASIDGGAIRRADSEAPILHVSHLPSARASAEYLQVVIYPRRTLSQMCMLSPSAVVLDVSSQKLSDLQSVGGGDSRAKCLVRRALPPSHRERCSSARATSHRHTSHVF